MKRAILVIDLCGYTECLEQYGADAAEAWVLALRASAQFHASAWRAELVQEIGDAVLILAETVFTARGIAYWVLTDLQNRGIRAKAAIGWGEIEQRETGPYGLELIHAQALAENERRNASSCRPGEIRLTRAAAESLR